MDGVARFASRRGVAIYDPDPATQIQRCQVQGLDLAAAVAVAGTQLGKPYDFTAVLGIGLHRDWTETDSWFCSELAAWACLHAGVPLLRFDRLNRITPARSP